MSYMHTTNNQYLVRWTNIFLTYTGKIQTHKHAHIKWQYHVRNISKHWKCVLIKPNLENAISIVKLHVFYSFKNQHSLSYILSLCLQITTSEFNKTQRNKIILLLLNICIFNKTTLKPINTLCIINPRNLIRLNYIKVGTLTIKYYKKSQIKLMIIVTCVLCNI